MSFLSSFFSTNEEKLNDKFDKNDNKIILYLAIGTISFQDTYYWYKNYAWVWKDSSISVIRKRANGESFFYFNRMYPRKNDFGWRDRRRWNVMVPYIAIEIINPVQRFHAILQTSDVREYVFSTKNVPALIYIDIFLSFNSQNIVCEKSEIVVLDRLGPLPFIAADPASQNLIYMRHSISVYRFSLYKTKPKLCSNLTYVVILFIRIQKQNEICWWDIRYI